MQSGEARKTSPPVRENPAKKIKAKIKSTSERHFFKAFDGLNDKSCSKFSFI